MPNRSCGFVWCPYSVTQTSALRRLNHFFRLSFSRGSDFSETFGHLTSWLGGEFGLKGYGWCVHASNLRRRFALATSSANLPGECVSDTPGTRRSRPRADVSPMPTFAAG